MRRWARKGGTRQGRIAARYIFRMTLVGLAPVLNFSIGRDFVGFSSISSAFQSVRNECVGRMWRADCFSSKASNLVGMSSCLLFEVAVVQKCKIVRRCYVGEHNGERSGVDSSMWAYGHRRELAEKESGQEGTRGVCTEYLLGKKGRALGWGGDWADRRECDGVEGGEEEH